MLQRALLWPLWSGERLELWSGEGLELWGGEGSAGKATSVIERVVSVGKMQQRSLSRIEKDFLG